MALTIYQGKQKIVCKFGWYRGNDFAPATWQGLFLCSTVKRWKKQSNKGGNSM